MGTDRSSTGLRTFISWRRSVAQRIKPRQRQPLISGQLAQYYTYYLQVDKRITPKKRNLRLENLHGNHAAINVSISFNFV